MLKLIKAYLNPTSFQKILVKLATQLISFTVAPTIKIRVEMEKLKFCTSLDTTQFDESTVQIFGYLNSLALYVLL